MTQARPSSLVFGLGTAEQFLRSNQVSATAANLITHTHLIDLSLRPLACPGYLESETDLGVYILAKDMTWYTSIKVWQSSLSHSCKPHHTHIPHISACSLRPLAWPGYLSTISNLISDCELPVRSSLADQSRTHGFLPTA